jgi:hypothetical protein
MDGNRNVMLAIMSSGRLKANVETSPREAAAAPQSFSGLLLLEALLWEGRQSALIK